ncbi:hypothetical protein DPMN_059686 [Dreissena polymorpha]|uniref:Secreted protein n=1 Tax=Dreissena polymorpha TaxID=45954 RepID=A0A9D4C3Y0_DREPO|nr:hypothetical protein DPMN_059686 [Dreissena polymorpha]
MRVFLVMVVSINPMSLLLSVPGNVLVSAWLNMDLNRCGARMKSIWLCTCPFGARQVTVMDGLRGCSVLARVS